MKYQTMFYFHFHRVVLLFSLLFHLLVFIFEIITIIFNIVYFILSAFICYFPSNVLVSMWRTGDAPLEWNSAVIKVFHKNKRRSECNNHRRILLVAHSGKALLKMVASRPSNYCETYGILPEEQGGVHRARSTVDRLFVVRRLQDLGRPRGSPLFMCSILHRSPESI